MSVKPSNYNQFKDVDCGFWPPRAAFETPPLAAAAQSGATLHFPGEQKHLTVVVEEDLNTEEALAQQLCSSRGYLVLHQALF